MEQPASASYLLNLPTICALSTSQGRGALSVIRVSGREAWKVVQPSFRSAKGKTVAVPLPNQVIFGTFRNTQKEVLDNVLVTLFRAPRSYTGEDVVEISCHGSPYIVQNIMEALIQAGAVLATPGEFTQRAFLNGKMDLVQAEAVGDLIAASSGAAHRMAWLHMRGGFSKQLEHLRSQLVKFSSLIELELDFSEEDVIFANKEELNTLLTDVKFKIEQLLDSFTAGNVIRNGIPVAIVGATNAGKSTLLNALLCEGRAIVSDQEGTTRDTIEELITIENILFRLIDTAGLRKATDSVENMGIERTYQKLSEAAMILVVLDLTHTEEEAQRILEQIESRQNEKRKQQILILLNKKDAASDNQIIDRTMLVKKHFPKIDPLPISAKQQAEVDKLKVALGKAADTYQVGEEEVVVTNVRHMEALSRTLEAVKQTIKGMNDGLSADLFSQDLRQAIHHIGQITGVISNDEVLENIFANFCIGK